MIGTSIMFEPVWKQIEPFLHIDVYDRDGGHEDPRIRIGFDGLPDALGRELVFFEMPCVACQRPIHPLRRREGDGFDRLYLAPACPLSVRVACSRGRAAMLEYQRFAGYRPMPKPQLSLF